jgi:hypothetical protein
MRLPAEAREGLSRVWLEILREKHPNVTWILKEGEELDQERRLATENQLAIAA